MAPSKFFSSSVVKIHLAVSKTLVPRLFLVALLGVLACSDSSDPPVIEANKCPSGPTSPCDCPWIEPIKRPTLHCKADKSGYDPPTCDCGEDKRAKTLCERVPELDNSCVYIDIKQLGIDPIYAYAFTKCSSSPIDCGSFGDYNCCAN